MSPTPRSAARPVPRGLYAITPTALCRDEAGLLAAVAEALRGGAVMIQYRDKSGDAARRRRQAHALRALCHDHDAPLIVNDDIALAEAAGADGVHLGRRDGDPRAARARLGEDAIIGVSCGPVIERVGDAEAAGASYAAIGRFFPSTTKPDAPAATLADLRAARAASALPLCAIGGITPARAAALAGAGARLIAAVAGVFEAGGVRAAAAAYADALTRAAPH